MVEYNWTSVVHKAAREIEHKIIMKPLLLNRVYKFEISKEDTVPFIGLLSQHLCSEPENTCTVEQHTWIVIIFIRLISTLNVCQTKRYHQNVFFFSQLYFSGNGMITVIKSIHVKCYAMHRSWDHTNHNLLANLTESLDLIWIDSKTAYPCPCLVSHSLFILTL